MSFVVILAFLCPLRGKWLELKVILCPLAGYTNFSSGYGFLLINRVKMLMLRQIMSTYYDSSILILLSMKFNYCEFMLNICKPATF